MNRHSSASSPISLPSQERVQPEIDSESTLETALATLKTGDFQSRWEAAKVIPAFGEASIMPLLDLLKLKEMGETGETEETDEIDEAELLWFIARILGNFNHPAAVDSLIRVLQSTNHPEVTAVAAAALAKYRLEAISPLIDLLAQSATRLTAVHALAQVQHPAVIQPLLSVVDDDSTEVRVAAVEALSHFYDPAITSVLQAALQDSATAVRRSAVMALGIQAEQGNRQALTEMVSPLLWDLSPEVCRQVSITLGRLGTTAAIEALSQVLQSVHTPTALQLEIVQALVWIGSVAALDPLHQFLMLNPTSGKKSSEKHLQVAQAIVTALGRVEDPEVQPAASQILLDLLHQRHPIAQIPQGQQFIARSLGQLRDPQAIEALIALLAEPEASVQFHAIAALKQLESRGSYRRLQVLKAESLPNSALAAGIETALHEWQAHENLD